jgi:hypothetical protein
MAANLRSIWGFARGAPVFSTQRFPAGTPQAGQATENNAWGVSSFFFIPTEQDDIQPRNPPFGDLPALAVHGNFDCSSQSVP